MNRQTFAVPAVVLLACVVAAVCFKSCQPSKPEFKSLTDVKSILEEKGFHCFIRETKTKNNILIVSTGKITDQQAVDFSHCPNCKPNDGKVAITEYLRGLTRRTENEAHWDGYFASGDAATLDRIEQILFP